MIFEPRSLDRVSTHVAEGSRRRDRISTGVKPCARHARRGVADRRSGLAGRSYPRCRRRRRLKHLRRSSPCTSCRCQSSRSRQTAIRRSSNRAAAQCSTANRRRVRPAGRTAHRRPRGAGCRNRSFHTPRLESGNCGNRRHSARRGLRSKRCRASAPTCKRRKLKPLVNRRSSLTCSEL